MRFVVQVAFSLECTDMKIESFIFARLQLISLFLSVYVPFHYFFKNKLNIETIASVINYSDVTLENNLLNISLRFMVLMFLII